jgi:phosphinothricin acetyltransferase
VTTPVGAELVVRAVALADASAIARIYNHYVAESIVTFEEVPISTDEAGARITAVGYSALPWLVAVDGDAIVGYAYATRWKDRRGYRFSVEVTIYVDPACARRNIGSQLYSALLPQLAGRGVHAALGGIALPNDASIRLHEKFGFRKVAHFTETGMKFGRWIDVGYWELLFL